MLRALTVGTYYITVGLIVTLRKGKRKFVTSFLNFLVYGIAEKDIELLLNISLPKNTHTVSETTLHSF